MNTENKIEKNKRKIDKQKIIFDMGELILNAREKKKLSRRKIADILLFDYSYKISELSLGRYERGELQLPYTLIHPLNEILDINLEYIPANINLPQTVEARFSKLNPNQQYLLLLLINELLN